LFCHKDEEISVENFVQMFSEEYNDLKAKIEKNEEIVLPFKICSCTPILFQMCTYYRVLHLIKDLKEKKIYFLTFI